MGLAFGSEPIEGFWDVDRHFRGQWKSLKPGPSVFVEILKSVSGLTRAVGIYRTTQGKIIKNLS